MMYSRRPLKTSWYGILCVCLDVCTVQLLPAPSLLILLAAYNQSHANSKQLASWVIFLAIDGSPSISFFRTRL